MVLLYVLVIVLIRIHSASSPSKIKIYEVCSRGIFAEHKVLFSNIAMNIILTMKSIKVTVTSDC